MHHAEEETTSFISKRGTYYYKRMPFGLKNVGATFQQLTNKMFSEMLRKNYGSLYRWYTNKTCRRQRPCKTFGRML